MLIGSVNALVEITRKSEVGIFDQGVFRVVAVCLDHYYEEWRDTILPRIK